MTKFGLMIFPTDYAVDPVVLGKEAEAFGFESLFFPEHTHIPASRNSPWPGGDELPKHYWHAHDPFIALSAVATATKDLMLGTGIALVTERDPILMAKQVASLDFLSKGRLILGVGAGWNAEEMENHGVAFSSRWKVLRERVLAMREIWEKEEAQFKGDFVNFDSMWSYPKPVQKNGPPVLLGASSKYVFRRIAEYGDGWFPLYQDSKRIGSGERINYAEGIAKTRDAWREKDREGHPDFSIFGVPPKSDTVNELIEFGFDRIIFGLPSADADTVLPLVEKLAAFAHDY